MQTIRRMLEADLFAVLQIEAQSYPVPWTERAFQDCLRVNYPSWVLIEEEHIVGYILFSVGADEAHLLNICIAPESRRSGLARTLLLDRLELLREKNVHTVFLEVRESSKPAIALYKNLGFVQLGNRKGYYKALAGREDALTFSKTL